LLGHLQSQHEEDCEVRDFPFIPILILSPPKAEDVIHALGRAPRKAGDPACRDPPV